MNISLLARAALPLIGLGLLIAAGCAGSPTPPGAGHPGACPPARQSDAICIQVVVWANNPETGQCCQYGNPCVVPEGWQAFYSQEECQQAQ